MGSVDTLMRRAEDAARFGVGALAGAGAGASAPATAAVTAAAAGTGSCSGGDAGRLAALALPPSSGGVGDTVARPLRPPLEQEAPIESGGGERGRRRALTANNFDRAASDRLLLGDERQGRVSVAWGAPGGLGRRWDAEQLIKLAGKKGGALHDGVHCAPRCSSWTLCCDIQLRDRPRQRCSLPTSEAASPTGRWCALLLSRAPLRCLDALASHARSQAAAQGGRQQLAESGRGAAALHTASCTRCSPNTHCSMPTAPGSAALADCSLRRRRRRRLRAGPSLRSRPPACPPARPPAPFFSQVRKRKQKEEDEEKKWCFYCLRRGTARRPPRARALTRAVVRHAISQPAPRHQLLPCCLLSSNDLLAGSLPRSTTW